MWTLFLLRPLQVQLLYELVHSWSSTWARLHKRGILRQSSSYPDLPAGPAPSSPVRSSAGTAPPDTSTCSPSADFGSPTEVRRPLCCYILLCSALCYTLFCSVLHTALICVTHYSAVTHYALLQAALYYALFFCYTLLCITLHKLALRRTARY